MDAIGLVALVTDALVRRGYGIVTQPLGVRGLGDAEVYVTVRPRELPYQLVVIVGRPHDPILLRSAATMPVLAADFETRMLPRIPDLAERDRLLDMTLGIEPPRVA